jgi:hypothetical protein
VNSETKVRVNSKNQINKLTLSSSQGSKISSKQRVRGKDVKENLISKGNPFPNDSLSASKQRRSELIAITSQMKTKF